MKLPIYIDMSLKVSSVANNGSNGGITLNRYTTTGTPSREVLVGDDSMVLQSENAVDVSYLLEKK